MPGFFDLPLELRDHIFSLATTPEPHLCGRPECKIWHPRSNRLFMRFTKPGGVARVAEPAVWHWLRTVSLVSKRFALEARPYFFRSSEFIIDDLISQFEKNRLAGTHGFLSWIRDEDAEFLKRIEVTSGLNGETLNAPMVKRLLPDLSGRNGRFGSLKLGVTGRVRGRSSSAKVTFRLDEQGRWTVVDQSPFHTVE